MDYFYYLNLNGKYYFRPPGEGFYFLGIKRYHYKSFCSWKYRIDKRGSSPCPGLKVYYKKW